jgi:hypothetical protein
MSEETKKTPEEVKAQLAALKDNTAAEESEFTKLLGEAEAKEKRELMGLDLEFNVEELLASGRVEQKGIPFPYTDEKTIYLDMHSLSKGDEIEAKGFTMEFLKQKGIELKTLTHEQYADYKVAGCLAYAITRINNKVFEATAEDRMVVMEFIIKSGDRITNALEYIYENLKYADVLINSDAQKKPSKP